MAAWVRVLLLAVGVAGFVAAIPLSGSSRAKVDFGRDILPLLSDRCFKCHGPDAGSRMADLRLDTPEGAYADRGGKWAIVPGKPGQSLVVSRINHASSPMPPRASGKSLSEAERALIAQWISEGAPYGKLWSFEPLPAAVSLPDVKSPWPRDDLDRFILHRLQSEGLSPNPPASRERWLRRITLDLTGLPPSEAEIDAFLADREALAFERVVDRLLASSRFGERMAADWLDAARYSDSYGYQSDLLMPTWPYRDWVVRAFNENLPYDQFVTQQLAGDLLPNATRDQRLATAFNRLHRQSNEGGSIALEFKTEYAVDRVDTFGTAFLGLTLGCARCHDHKFDPIRQKEFYQLFAYFNSIDEFGLLLSTEIVPTPSLLLPTPEQEARLENLKKERAQLEVSLDSHLHSALEPESGAESRPSPLADSYRFSLDSPGERFDAEPAGRVFMQTLGKPERVAGRTGKAVRLDGETGLVLRGGAARDRWDPFSWAFWIRDPGATGTVVLLHRTGGTDVGFCGFDLLLENGHLTARIMRHWPGNAVAIRTKQKLTPNEWSHVGWSWDGSGRAAGLRLYLDGRMAAVEVLNDRLWKRIHAYGDLGPSGGDWAFGQRFRDAGFKGGVIDDVLYADREMSPFEIAWHYNGRGFEDLSKAHHSTWYRSPVLEAKEAIRKKEREIAEAEEGIQEISVMEEAPHPIYAYVLARGQYDSPRTEANRVERGVPESLPPIADGGRNDRLALARWLTEPSHPLTARVAVNRLWQLMFGVGLVETSENFGVQGSRPSHPELLDFLARRFVAEGWDVKKLLRRIALSATYRQDSIRSSEKIHKDPRNRWLSAGPSGRLTAEMIRDLALAASGLLNDKLGGPPVNPYQPAGIWQEFNTMSPGFVQSKGPDLYRRSLYSTWKRTTPVPSMVMFDANTRESCMTRRPSTNTPLQALVLLNDVQFVEAARVLAERVLKSSTQDETRIRMAFRRLAGREPDRRELAILMQALDEQRARFRRHVYDAGQLIRVGDSAPDATLRPSELAAMAVVVQTILNSDAVIGKR